jgi:chorismate mutase
VKAVRGIRGAIQVDRDRAEQILDGTSTLLREILSRNRLRSTDLISALFTMTPDLVSCFPAAAAHELVPADLPLLCATEIAVPGALPRVIRVLLHAYSARRHVVHVYLGGAAALRPDLAGPPRARAEPTHAICGGERQWLS